MFMDITSTGIFTAFHFAGTTHALKAPVHNTHSDIFLFILFLVGLNRLVECPLTFSIQTSFSKTNTNHSIRIIPYIVCT